MEDKTTVEKLLEEDYRVASVVCHMAYCETIGEGSLHVGLDRVTRYDGRVPGRSLLTTYHVSKGQSTKSWCHARQLGEDWLQGREFLQTDDPQEAVDTYNRWVDEYEVVRKEAASKLEDKA